MWYPKTVQQLFIHIENYGCFSERAHPRLLTYKIERVLSDWIFKQIGVKSTTGITGITGIFTLFHEYPVSGCCRYGLLIA